MADPTGSGDASKGGSPAKKITLPRPQRPCTRRSGELPKEEIKYVAPPKRTKNKKSTGPAKVGRPRKYPVPEPVVVAVLPPAPAPAPTPLPPPPPVLPPVPPPEPVVPVPAPPNPPPIPAASALPGVSGQSRIMQIEVKPQKNAKKPLPMKTIVVKKQLPAGPIMALSKMDKKPSGTSIILKKGPEGQMLETKPIVVKTPIMPPKPVVAAPPAPKVEKIVIPKKDTFLMLQTSTAKKPTTPEKRKPPTLVLLTEKKVEKVEESAQQSVTVILPSSSSNQPPVAMLYRSAMPLVTEPFHPQPSQASAIIQALRSDSLAITQPSHSASNQVVHAENIRPTLPVQSINQVAAAPVVVSTPSSSANLIPATNVLPGISPPSTSVLPDLCSSASHVDETIDEVARGNFTRPFDSDSTLTSSETEQLELRMAAAAPPVKRTSTKKKKTPVEELPPTESVEKAKQRFKGEVSAMKRSNSGSRKSARAGLQTPPESALASFSMQETSREPVSTGKRPKQTSTALMFPLTSSTEGMTETAYMPAALATKFAAGGPKTPAVLREVSVEVKPPPTEPKKPYYFVQAEISDGEDSSDPDDVMVPQRTLGSTASRENDTSFEFADSSARGRARMRSMSIASDATFDTISTANQWSGNSATGTSTAAPAASGNQTASASNLPHSRSRKKSMTAGAHRIGSHPLTDLGRWKPQDDMLLLSAIQEYRDLGLVHKNVKLSCHFTILDIQERWFNLLYNKKISKAACQAMRACPPDVMADIERQTPFTEAEEALLSEISLFGESPTLEVFELLLEANAHVFHPFRSAGDLEKHWRIMLADGRIDNSDTYCVVPDEQIIYNSERILTFAEVEHRMKDVDLKNWVRVSGEFAYEMEKIQRQNRERMMNLEKEIEHIRFLLERTLNYELPDLVRPEFRSPQDRSFLAIIIGQHAKFGMRTGKVSLGRSTPGKVVDIDFSMENYAGKLSRLQGYIILERNGTFRIENHGRRPVFVNEDILHYGDSAVLIDSSSIKAGDIYVQFFINHSRVGRYLRQKYAGEWISEEETEELEPERKAKPKTVKRKPIKIEALHDHLLPTEPSPRRTRSKYRGRSREIPAPSDPLPIAPTPLVAPEVPKSSKKKRPPRKPKSERPLLPDLDLTLNNPPSEPQIPIKFSTEDSPKLPDFIPASVPVTVPPPPALLPTLPPLPQPDPVPLPPITSLPPRRTNFADLAAMAGLGGGLSVGGGASSFSVVPSSVIVSPLSSIATKPMPAFDASAPLRPWLKSADRPPLAVKKPAPPRKSKNLLTPLSNTVPAGESAVTPALPTPISEPAVESPVVTIPHPPLPQSTELPAPPPPGPVVGLQASGSGLAVSQAYPAPVSSTAIALQSAVASTPLFFRPSGMSTTLVGQSLFSVPSGLFPGASLSGARKVYTRPRPTLMPPARPRLPTQPTQPVLMDNGVPISTSTGSEQPDAPKTA